MDQRLKSLLTLTPEQTVPSIIEADNTSVVEDSNLRQSPGEAVAPGWRLLDTRSGWKPSPLGVHVAAT